MSAPPLLASLLDVLQAFRIALTKPSFVNMIVVVLGWLQTQGTHAVTEALVLTGIAGQRHHEAFHRFFSRAQWEPDEMGLWLFRRLEPYLGNGAVRVAIDDTLAPKKGPRVFGIATHVDAVRSTRKHRVFCFGHCWVVLAVLMRVPFSKRTWGLPVLFRLYRSKKETPKADYAKKTELACELLRVFVGWVGDRPVELTIDMGYCNNTVAHDLPSSVVLFGAMRTDAALTALPGPRPAGARGRPKLRGAKLPKPQEVANDASIPWSTAEAFLYGKKRRVRFKTFCAQWYRACGVRLLRVVVVLTEHGQVPIRVFCCTDPNLDVVHILETYAGRWGIEVFFREAKQLLGLADSAARREHAVRRVAPLVGMLYSVLVVWFLEHHGHTFTASVPLRPWYRHKSGLSFADILRQARGAIATANILDLVNDLDNFKKTSPPTPPARPSDEKLAA